MSIQKFHGKGEKILIVEDEEDILKLTAALLRKNNYSVSEASSVQEALDIFRQKKGEFSLILSDYRLPDQTGLDLINQLLLYRPELQILLVSGYAIPKSQWAVIREKGYRFLQKPYTLSDLLQTVREMIEPGDQ
ncbi:MAG: response regulator [bacterium]